MFLLKSSVCVVRLIEKKIRNMIESKTEIRSIIRERKKKKAMDQVNIFKRRDTYALFCVFSWSVREFSLRMILLVVLR